MLSLPGYERELARSVSRQDSRTRDFVVSSQSSAGRIAMPRTGAPSQSAAKNKHSNRTNWAVAKFDEGDDMARGWLGWALVHRDSVPIAPCLYCPSASVASTQPFITITSIARAHNT